MTFEARLRPLNDRPPVAGAYVLYWMQQSQRAAFNPALEYAIGEANRLGLPVVVGFGLMDGYPDANRRHYAFMLQGLQEVQQALRARGIGFVVRRGSPTRSRWVSPPAPRSRSAMRATSGIRSGGARRFASEAPCRGHAGRSRCRRARRAGIGQGRRAPRARSGRSSIGSGTTASSSSARAGGRDSIGTATLRSEVDLARPRGACSTGSSWTTACRRCAGSGAAPASRASALAAFPRRGLEGYADGRERARRRCNARCSAPICTSARSRRSRSRSGSGTPATGEAATAPPTSRS